MFTIFLKQITIFFDRAFLLGAFFPTLIFACINTVFWVFLGGIENRLIWWRELAEEYHILIPILFLTFTIFIAYFLQAFQLSLTRFYEGYWPNWPGINHWRKFKIGHHDSIRDDLSKPIVVSNTKDESPEEIENIVEEKQRRASEEIRKLYTLYPMPKKLPVEPLDNSKQIQMKNLVMPTRLGNILSSAEAYAFDRYGLVAAAVWPRLYHELPKEFQETLQGTRTNLDLFLVLTTLSVLTGAGWQLYLAFNSHDWQLFLFASLFWLIAIICYRSALQVALIYSTTLKSTFDLHRWELLQALHIALPSNQETEKSLWLKISQFLYYSVDAEIDYQHKPPKPSQAKK